MVMLPLAVILFVAGIVALVRARRSLVRILSRRYPAFYAEVSDPRHTVLTSRRTFRLQRFIYSLYPEKTGDPELVLLCNFLRFATPIMGFASVASLVVIAILALD